MPYMSTHATISLIFIFFWLFWRKKEKSQWILFVVLLSFLKLQEAMLWGEMTNLSNPDSYLDPPPHTTQTCKLSKEIIHRTINRFRKAFIPSIMQENIKKRLHNEIPTVLAWKRTTCKPMKVSKCILMANDILWKYWCKSQFPWVCDICTLRQFQNVWTRAGKSNSLVRRGTWGPSLLLLHIKGQLSIIFPKDNVLYFTYDEGKL